MATRFHHELQRAPVQKVMERVTPRQGLSSGHRGKPLPFGISTCSSGAREGLQVWGPGGCLTLKPLFFQGLRTTQSCSTAAINHPISSWQYHAAVPKEFLWCIKRKPICFPLPVEILWQGSWLATVSPREMVNPTNCCSPTFLSSGWVGFCGFSAEACHEELLELWSLQLSLDFFIV